MAGPIMFDHKDLLIELNRKYTVSEKVAYLHQVTRENFSFVDRIAIAVYDRACDMLKTFAHSTDNGNPLPYYEARLVDTGSLREILEKGNSRVIHDLDVFAGNSKEHARNILKHGYRASYTVPMFQDSEFIGFTFFNSRQSNAFVEQCLGYLDMVARLLALIVGAELTQVKTLRGALKMATHFTQHRDPETGAHLERMARYTRLIAREAAPKYGFDDEFIESIYWFSPLHDVGKIAVPDSILLKPGRLSPQEFEVMKIHTVKGRDILSSMAENFDFDNSRHVSMLGNIACYHHENLDGSGYPEGRRGTEIPVEARIVAVADVFDALTSDRPYKVAWNNDDAFTELQVLVGQKLDRSFVEALEKNREAVEQIQRRFRDHPSAEPGDDLTHSGFTVGGQGTVSNARY